MIIVCAMDAFSGTEGVSDPYAGLGMVKRE